MREVAPPAAIPAQTNGSCPHFAPRLTDIDNVFLLWHARRLPFEKRDVLEEVRNQRQAFPIDPAIIARFVTEIQAFIDAVWYNPNEVLKRGSFA
jgi:hypothetical protein